MSYEIYCTFITETKNAVLIQDDDTAEEHWFPLSHVKVMHKNKQGSGSIVVSDWIAREKGYDP